MSILYKPGDFDLMNSNPQSKHLAIAKINNKPIELLLQQFVFKITAHFVCGKVSWT